MLDFCSFKVYPPVAGLPLNKDIWGLVDYKGKAVNL